MFVLVIIFEANAYIMMRVTPLCLMVYDKACTPKAYRVQQACNVSPPALHACFGAGQPCAEVAGVHVCIFLCANSLQMIQSRVVHTFSFPTNRFQGFTYISINIAQKGAHLRTFTPQALRICASGAFTVGISTYYSLLSSCRSVCEGGGVDSGALHWLWGLQRHRLRHERPSICHCCHQH